MIQGDLRSLDKRQRRRSACRRPAAACGARAAPTETPAQEGVQIDGLTVVDGQGVTRLDNFTLTIGRGEIVGVAGVEGNGQSELGAVLSGMAAPASGHIFLGDIETTHATPKQITAAGIGVVPEDRHAVGCIVEMTVAENMFLNRLEDFTSIRLPAPQGAGAGGARVDDAVRCARRRARTWLFRRCPAAISRRRCWRAS